MYHIIDMILVLLGLLALSAVGSSRTVKHANNPVLLRRAQNLLKRLDVPYGNSMNKKNLAAWDYKLNLSNENELNLLNATAQVDDLMKHMSYEINKFPWRKIKDFDTRRQCEKIAFPGAEALSNEKYKELMEIIHEMKVTYLKARICDFKNSNKCNIRLEHEIRNSYAKIRDPEQLKHLWIKSRDVSGKMVKEDFVRYVRLSNEIARLNNYTDMAAYWLKDYETDDFLQQMGTVWQELKPLYLQLHAYVRRQLRMKYGEDIVSKDGPIPAHLLGDILWTQSWKNVAKFGTPYPGKKLPDVTDAMIAQEWNVTKIYHTAEDFFLSLNLSVMPETFWKNSILEKQKGVKMNCRASAWDFYDGKDFRIKMCTAINMAHLVNVHREMGKIQYYIQYKDQPTVFKNGASPGFHEAVGDTIALSSSTTNYYKHLGLLDDAKVDREAIINNLYSVALSTIVSLPFIYAMEKWRLRVFQGTIHADEYNCNWWSLAEELQGIKPPVDRSENDFDPGAIHPIVKGEEYMKHYMRAIVQFQFHKALCIEAGQYDLLNPQSKRLNECNIYGSEKAGRLLKSMLELGSSKPWPDAMEKITGQRRMDSSGLWDYFKPLMDWLELENEKTNEHVGWKSSKRVCRGKN